MAAISGWSGRVRIQNLNAALHSGGVLMPATRWQVTWKADALDATTFENLASVSAGVSQATPQSSWLAGITDTDVSLDLLWDTTINPFISSPPGIGPGDYSQVTLYFDTTAADKSGTTAFWLFSNCMWIDVVMDAEVRGIVKYSLTGRQSGASNPHFPSSAT